MGQFSNSFPKHFSYLSEYAIRFDLSCSFCEYPFIFHCLHCSPSCFDPDSLLLAYFWLGLSWIDCISANKSFSSSKTSSRKPYTSSKQQERHKHSVEITINLSNDEEIAALDLQGAASPMEVEGELPDMNAEEMAKEGFYLVKSVLRHRYRQGWRFLTLWEGFGVEEATWEPFSAFVLPEGRLNSVLVDYLSKNSLGELLRLAETLASKTKPRD